MLVVELGVVVDVVVLVDVVLVDVLVVDVLLVDDVVVELVNPGGPSWQWFVSP